MRKQIVWLLCINRQIKSGPSYTPFATGDTR